MRTTQDDTRENMQIELFELEALQGRSNKYIPDARVAIEGVEHLVELKTADARRKSVSTARNVTLAKIDEWEKVWWLFSLYEKDIHGNISLIEHYLGNKHMLRPWFNKQRTSINKGSKKYGGLASWEKAYNILKEHMNKDELDRLNHSFHMKGVGLNDPKIPWSFIQKHCVRLNDENLASALRKAMVKEKKYRKNFLNL